MAWVLHNAWKEGQFDGSQGTTTPVDFDLDDLRVALITSAVAPDPATHGFWGDLQANEVSGTNYTAGGEALTSLTLTEASGTVTFDADDVTWLQDAAGFSDARHAILYNFTATAADAVIVASADLGGDKGNVSGDLTLQMDAAGIFTAS